MTNALTTMLNIIEDSNAPLVMSEEKLLDFLCDNCKDLDSKTVHQFLLEVRSEMEVD